MQNSKLDRFKGCLLGGAVGDALGYSVEFYNISQIRQRYGPNGITSFDLVDGVAIVSDDTQMTLFTANGILTFATQSHHTSDPAPMMDHVYNAYADWFRTQRFGSAKKARVSSWIYNVPELHSVRAPGGTCLNALSAGIRGTLERPVNSSKGCGGVMRCAPIGLYCDRTRFSVQEADLLGAQSAALTHGHPLGFLSAAALVHIVNQIVYGDFHGDDALYDIAYDCIRTLGETFARYEKTPVLIALLREAIRLSRLEGDDLSAIEALGEGWVGEEAIAIALYCALRHRGDFERAMIASVNHSGDSDSTGSITGNILGAYLGLGAIPAGFINALERKDVITTLCEDLYAACQDKNGSVFEDGIWQQKYIKATYRM